MKGPLREAFSTSLTEMRRAYATVPRQECSIERAWKLFLLTPRMLLWRPGAKGAVGERLLLERVARLREGRWTELIDAARESGRGKRRFADNQSPEAEKKAMMEQAVAMVRNGGLSNARQRLTAAKLAPGNSATLDELKDPARRPQQLTEPLDQATVGYTPPTPLTLDRKIFASSVRTARRGAAGGCWPAKVSITK